MAISATKSWQREFGLTSENKGPFFADKASLATFGDSTGQSHILRSAFDLLKLDGIFCAANVPLIYFKEVRRIDPVDIARLHRKFWNHGGAPILVVISPREIQIYSGLVRPEESTNSHNQHVPGLVESIDRASEAVKDFLTTVQSGEYFRSHPKSFNPTQRVDRDLLDNLQALRETLAAEKKLEAHILDALLCRLVFACYLFDRKIVGKSYLTSIGLRGASHLRDLLAVKPKTSAIKYLYALFRKLGKDFNGDLFSDELENEAHLVPASYMGPLDEFFRATDVHTGQTAFWPYDFAAIPIEAISAIYERFLKANDKAAGAFYTPRFLAELVLDLTLEDTKTLLNQRYLDPACGSGIFLVGLFNRIAEEWKRTNPDARNDRRARELRKILCSNLYGVDINPTACRISAFSLYLAYLDQLSPRDIKELKKKGHKLPKLVHQSGDSLALVEGNIWCGDFFEERGRYPFEVDRVVGNPPWGSIAVKGTAAAAWCNDPAHNRVIPDAQIAAAFVWKAPQHLGGGGRACLVLPHGTIFNHNTTALDFQRSFFRTHKVEKVLNLVDYQFFLFDEARHPAIVVKYNREAPPKNSRIEYWGPKSDWLVTRAEVISVMPEDRCELSLQDVLTDLDSDDAPQIWKQNYWASQRDRRLVQRLALYARLRDRVRQSKDDEAGKPWIIAEGFQPLGENDDPDKAKTTQLPSKRFIQATSKHLDLFLLEEDCSELASQQFAARRASEPKVFQGPHVIVAKGFTSVAFADFDVSFRHALRGISGPTEDRNLLIFLAAYLRSGLARFYLFHTSSNWGVSRQEVHVEELLRLPFPHPDKLPDPKRAWEIVEEVAGIVDSAAAGARGAFGNREQRVVMAREAIEPLIGEYFDLLPIERALVADTNELTIPSVRPTRARKVVPTIEPSQQSNRNRYIEILCQTLNSWARPPSQVQGRSFASAKLGVAVVILQKVERGDDVTAPSSNISDVLSALARLRTVTAQRLNSFELIRSSKVFDRNFLYLVKPIGRRFWTATAALNDADEIAGTILMQTGKESA